MSVNGVEKRKKAGKLMYSKLHMDIKDFENRLKILAKKLKNPIPEYLNCFIDDMLFDYSELTKIETDYNILEKLNTYKHASDYADDSLRAYIAYTQPNFDGRAFRAWFVPAIDFYITLTNHICTIICGIDKMDPDHINNRTKNKHIKHPEKELFLRLRKNIEKIPQKYQDDISNLSSQALNFITHYRNEFIHTMEGSFTVTRSSSGTLNVPYVRKNKPYATVSEIEKAKKIYKKILSFINVILLREYS